MRRTLLALLVTAGCSAQMINAPGSAVANAPVNEGERPGTVKYRRGGAGESSRRADAYEQMAKACGGKYRIDAEGPQTDTPVVMPVGDVPYVIPQEWWYIQFSCVRS